MIPRMTALLIALLAVLLSGPAFGAESLGSVPQTENAEVVDAVADKQVLDLPSQTLRSAPEPNKNGMDAATEVEMQRGLNELRREFLDDRAKAVDWWLTATAIFLTLLGVVAVLAGYFSFKKFDDIKAEISQHAEEAKAEISQHAEEAKNLVEEIKEHRAKAEAYKEEMEKVTAQAVSQKPDETARTAASIQENPEASLLDRAIAAAVQLQQQEKIGEAIEKWRSIATVAGEEDRPLQARAWFSIGHLRSVGEGIDLEVAADAYTKAIELDPTLAVAYNNRGNAKAALGQHEAALADYDRAIELNPTYATAYYNRGNTKHALGQHEAALADYDRAIELNPTYATAYSNRGNTKAALGQHEAALADYDRAIELNPTLATAYYNRGNTKHALGQHEAALADYDRAIELNPTYATAYYNRGNTKESLGRITEAREDYQEALALAHEAGDEEAVTKAQDNLSRLDNNEAP